MAPIPRESLIGILCGVTKYLLPLLALAPQLSHAHFIWATYDASSRSYRVEFAESPNDDRLDLSDELIGRTTLSGKEKLSRVEKGLFEMPARNRAIPFDATMEYGVVERGEKPYMLRYQFRAFDRVTSASQPYPKSLSLSAVPEPQSWKVVTYWDGKPNKDADLFLTDGTQVKRGADGAFHVPLAEAPTEQGLRASLQVPGAGKFQGKEYAFTKVWVTAVLPALDRIPEKSDAEAYRLLELAGDSRESLGTVDAWKSSFVAENLKTAVVVKGKAIYEGASGPSFTFEEPEHRAVKHVTEQLESLFMHRGSRPFWKGDGRYPISFTGSKNRLGPEIAIADSMDSTYRVKDGRMSEVSRTLGGKRLVIEIVDVQKLPCGRYLSSKFIVRSYDPETKKLEQELTYVDKFVQFGDEWMPKERTMSGTSFGEQLSMKLTFDNYTSK